MFQILQDELVNLKLAVEREKGKKGGKAGKKGKKDKKSKKDKGKKGKKEKDLTSNRTMESLVEELIQTGLLQKYTPSRLTSVMGDFNLTGVSTSKDQLILPSIADLRSVIIT